MYHIKTLNKISPYGLELFDAAKYTISDDVENADAILVRSASMHEMELDESIAAIARAGAGVNNIPLEQCSQAGICVFNTPGANANAVKEMVLLGLLMASRKVADSMEWIKTLKGSGAGISKLVEKGKSQFVGPEIMGKKIGVIGLGAIGVLVANAAEALGMTVYGYDPYLSVENAWQLSKNIKHAASLHEIYQECDYITLHVPATDSTRGMIDAASIELMKKGVRILNFSRGELVNSQNLLAAVDNGTIAAYVTDFPTDEMIAHPGITVFPHLGASTPESEDNCAKMAAMELIDYLENGNIRNSVNLPTASMPRSTADRVCIIHKNIVAMITKISAVLADYGVNIENLLNQSRKDYAYTMLDISKPIADEVIEKLYAIEGIIKIRVLNS